MKRLTICLLILILPGLAIPPAYAASGAMLVKDINPMPDTQPSSWPSHFVAVGDSFYFIAQEDTTSQELWRSDGTPAGTRLVKDIALGPESSYIDWLTNVNGTLFFVAYEDNHGLELWKSNGTAASTTLVKDIIPGADGSNPSSLTNVNGTLFFVAYERSGDAELWRNDGTANGTINRYECKHKISL